MSVLQLVSKFNGNNSVDVAVRGKHMENLQGTFRRRTLIDNRTLDSFDASVCDFVKHVSSPVRVSQCSQWKRL
jgi:hypothetical protein